MPYCLAASLALLPSMAFGEILAMVNYETKSPESLKALKSPVAAPARKEGIAIIDVDPTSKAFGRIVQDIALPGDLVAHHIFYNRDQSKAYVTALGKEELRVIDMKKKPYAIGKVVAVPGCSVGEDVVFSDDGKYWYLSCMGTQAMVVGDARKDEPLKTVKVAAPYPHGIAIHDGIDRILLSSTVRASDLGDAGEAISAVEASSGKVLGTYKVSNKPSPAEECAGGDPVRSGRESAGGLCHQHVRRHALDRHVECGEEGFRRAAGSRFLGAGRRRAAGDLLQQEGGPHVRDHRQARAHAHLRPGRRGRQAEAR